MAWPFSPIPARTGLAQKITSLTGVLPNENVEKEIISSRLNSTEKSQGSSSLISRDGPFYFKIVYGNNNANKFSRVIISIEKKKLF